MFDLPSRTSADARPPEPGHVWTLDGFAEWCAAHPGVPPSQVLCALVAVLLDRYGAAMRLVAAPGCGEAGAAVALLAGSDPAWPALLSAVTGAPDAADTEPPGDRPVVLVTDSDTPTPAGDLVWIAGETTVEVRLRPAVFGEQSVARMVGHLRRLLAELPGHGDRPLSLVTVLTEEETRLNGGTPRLLPVYPPVTLHQLVELQAWKTPDACALASGDEALSYRELNEVSNVLAHQLVAAGLRPSDVVAVGGERSLGLFTALLAVLKAGGVFLHLDPDLPEPRLRQFLEVGRPRLVVRAAGARIPVTDLPEVAVPSGWDPASIEARTAPDVVVGPEDPAYVLFTSGSTGVPKGVLRSHRLHVSRVFLEQGMYHLGPDDRHLLKLPISARELFWPLATGGTAVIARPGGERDDDYLRAVLRDERISVISVVPSMLRALAADGGIDDLPHLRHIFVGGEALPPDLEAAVRAHGYGVHNTYTLTEADYVAHRGGPLAEPAGESTVIGRPIDMRVYLCDERDRLVPPGLDGEMLVGGPGLATGYLGDPARTAERFVPNPFGDPQAPLLFRTGDLARHRADGALEYRGRRDLQVKVRGHRVEPTEVEHRLREHAGVQAVAVAGYPDPQQGAVLVAFLVAGEPEPDNRSLREFLAERLPAAMVPRHFVRLPRLPVLPSGKVDRASLQPPGRERSADLPPPVAPQTPTQARLSALWRRVLHADETGIDDTFVDLGGDSLRVILLRAAIQDEFGDAPGIADLMRRTTIRQQADLLDGVRPDVPPPTAGRADRTRQARAEANRRAGLRAAATPEESLR
ncbi:non-ribosomal peptide synthetase [Actinoplanes sp. LDG1-06]|uniref:Non-ribosomal peptide synthetase n=1 Tax=Paractinoplanes ovalisporus TaxID=2810368 RepID=A0ABS2AKS3_9ACTN|nr:non-ribosomal peptide synthetase [Actinoplanes ovalisporus]MBM2620373.1 non-ribosomal peptide synthetase [Actinoplanes ovalisporus]